MDGPSGRSYTFEQLTLLSKKFGSALTKKGFKKGDVFSILLPNIPEFPIIYYGVILIGGVVTTMNPMYTVEEITHQLQDAGATFIITIPLFAEKAKESTSSLGINTVYVVGEAEGCESLSVLLQDDGKDFPENVEINPKEDVACLPYSSGTTGVPKGVMLTHYNLIACASIVTHESFMWNKEEDAAVLGLLPFFHSFGQVISMSCALFKGAKVVCVPKFEPESFLKIIQEHKVGNLFLSLFLLFFFATTFSFPAFLLVYLSSFLLLHKLCKYKSTAERSITNAAL